MLNDNPGQIPHCKSCTCAMEHMRNEIEWRDKLISELRKDLHTVEHQRDKLLTNYEEVTIPFMVETQERLAELYKPMVQHRCPHGRPECECDGIKD